MSGRMVWIEPLILEHALGLLDAADLDVLIGVS